MSLILLRSLIVWLVATVILTAAFVTNPLRLHALPWFLRDRPAEPLYAHATFDNNSDVLVQNAVINAQRGQPIDTGGFLFHYKDDPRVLDVAAARAFDPQWLPGETKDVVVYKSSYGLQGRFYAAIASGRASLRFLSAALAAAVLAIFVAWIERRHGARVAAIVCAVCVLSVGLTLFAVTSYFVLWLSLLPFVLGLVLPWRLSLVAIYLTLVLRFLCGFEFASTIAMAAAIGAVVHRRNVITVGVVSIAAAATALAIYGHAAGGLAHLWSRRAEWAAASGLLDGVKKTLLINVFSVLPLGVAVLILGALAWRWRSTEWARATFFAAAAGLSWVLLQPQHLFFHPRYACFLFAVPLTPVAAVWIALALTKRASTQ